ncbi:MAG: ATP-binding protein [Sphingomonadaceae bacterium]
MKQAIIGAIAGLLTGLLAYFAVRAAGGDTALGVALLLVATLFASRLTEQLLTERQEDSIAEASGANHQADPQGDAVPVAALPEAALLVSDKWRVLAANEAAVTLFESRLVGSDVRQTLRYPAVAEAVRQALDSDAPTIREITALGGQEGYLRLRAVPVGAGRLLLTVTDISQTRLSERMRSDFVANASHELRTPLANIMGFIETLQGPAAGDEAATSRFLTIMSREAARMARLIDDLLSLSRIELDRYVRPSTALPVAPLLTEVKTAFGQQLAQGNRELQIDMPEDLPDVLADHDQIMQVLHNLVSNAIKYGRAGTPIRIIVRQEAQRRDSPMLRIAVADEGEGIPKEHLPRLTERFYRADTGRSRSLGGTGLGLAIVKHIVERHRGRVEIDSEPGKGSVFAFLLPVAPAGIETGAVVTKV